MVVFLHTDLTDLTIKNCELFLKPDFFEGFAVGRRLSTFTSCLKVKREVNENEIKGSLMQT